MHIENILDIKMIETCKIKKKLLKHYKTNLQIKRLEFDQFYIKNNINKFMFEIKTKNIFKRNNWNSFLAVISNNFKIFKYFFNN